MSLVCTNNKYTLATQAAVDAFAPCTNVTATNYHLKIIGEINDFSPLDDLTSVGYLEIKGLNASSITSLANLFPSLENILSGLYIDNNDYLTSLHGFENLIQTGDSFDIAQHDSLESLTGFSSLQSVGFSMEFWQNPLLATLPEFESLTEVGSSLNIFDTALEAITGFPSLMSVGYSFGISGNPYLEFPCGFYNYFTQPPAGPAGTFPQVFSCAEGSECGYFNFENNGAGLDDYSGTADYQTFLGSDGPIEACTCGGNGQCEQYQNAYCSNGQCATCKEIGDSCLNKKECCSGTCSGSGGSKVCA